MKLIVIGLFSACLTLTACGSTQTDIDYSKQEYSEVQEIDQLVESIPYKELPGNVKTLVKELKTVNEEIQLTKEWEAFTSTTQEGKGSLSTNEFNTESEAILYYERTNGELVYTLVLKEEDGSIARYDSNTDLYSFAVEVLPHMLNQNFVKDIQSLSSGLKEWFDTYGRIPDLVETNDGYQLEESSLVHESNTNPVKLELTRMWPIVDEISASRDLIANESSISARWFDPTATTRTIIDFSDNQLTYYQYINVDFTD